MSTNSNKEVPVSSLEGSGGSGDSIGKKQRKCELVFENILEQPSYSLERIDSLPANSSEAQSFIQENREALTSVVLSRDAVRETLQKLHAKRAELEEWIKQAFEVEDLEQQIYLLNAKRRFSEVSHGSDEGSHGNSGSDPSKSSEKPKLRLKLGTDHSLSQPQQHQTVSQKAPAAGNPPAGRGSKNLGRISRQTQETTAPELKPKVPNQVPIATFWNYIEQFFKKIDENDMKYLDDPNRIVDPTLFTIPPLGKHYSEQWREKYGYGTGSVGIHSLPNNNCIVPLKDRILSMLVTTEPCDVSDITKDYIPSDGDCEEGGDVENHADSTNAAQDKGGEHKWPPKYSTSLDNRLRRDLAEAGFIDPKVAGKDYQEDDELCVEMRRLQCHLRELSLINQYRKKRLAEYVRRRVLPSQELYSLIDEIDKQLAVLYIKSTKGRKKGIASKKTTASSSVSAATIATESMDVQRLLSNRERLVAAFVPEIGPRSTYLLSGAVEGDPLFDPAAEDKLKRDCRESGMFWFS